MSRSIKEIDDVDDDMFISKKPQNYIFAEKKMNDINERTSKMLLNTKTIVQESEQVGQSTLEQLSTQRETLERVENDLDSINAMTRATQKHLNNMKSFFGGIKSLFSSSGSSSSNSQTIIPTTKNNLPRSATVTNLPSDIPVQSSKKSFDNKRNQSSNNLGSQNLPTSSVQDDFEANLSEIGFGLGRLKEMAMKLGDEIGDQNEMLDRITEKSERAGDSVKHQNRQINQLLNK